MEVKAWYQSKTIWGAIITVLSLIISVVFGVQIDEATKQVLIDQAVALATAIGVLFGSIVSIYGRIKAEKKIGK
jgi:uncharacterized membrane protein